MITDRDITTRVVAEAADPKTTSVADVYSRDLISVEPDNDLEEALQTHGPPPSSAAARCRERQARRHRCPGRHRPQRRTRRRPVSSSRRSRSARRESAGSTARPAGRQNAFAADFHSRRRCAMSSARSSSLPSSSSLRSEAVGSKVDAGGSGIQPGVAIRPCRPVPGGAVGGLHRDLAGALELWGIRVPRALAPPEVEDAGRIPALLGSLAPVAGRQRAVLLPGPAGHVQATVAVPRDAQEAHRRRFFLASHGERELPPQPFDRAAATLGLDRLAELLVDRANLRRAGGRVVADGGQPDQVARQLRPVRVEDERTPDAERAAEQPGLEHNVVARRRLARLGRIRGGPVVLSEHERGEIDFLGELDEPVERGPPRVERGRPGLDVGDVFEPARDRLKQLGLLPRRPEEDARLVHARFMIAGPGWGRWFESVRGFQVSSAGVSTPTAALGARAAK